MKLRFSLKKRLTLALVSWLIVGVAITSFCFYFLINLQSRDIEKRILDKGRLFSLILGVNLDKIVGDNLRAYQELNEAASLIKKSYKQVEKLRVILPELIIISSSQDGETYKSLEEEYRVIAKKVFKESKPLSILKKGLNEEKVIHFFPLLGSSSQVMGVMQIEVNFPSQNVQLLHSLRIDKSSYFIKEASSIAKDLNRMLRKFLIQAQRNFSYLKGFIANLLSEEDIKDIKIFLKDLNILISGSFEKGVGFLIEKEKPYYKEVMEKEKTLVSKADKGNLKEFISPLYLSRGEERIPSGVISITLSLDRINSLISQRRNTLIAMSIVITGMFCLVVFLFFKKKILNPLKELSLLSQKVAQADFSVRAKVSSSDELGRLADSFNLMVEKLSKYRGELQSWNRRLEEKVREITEELKEKQAKLLESEKITSLGVLSSGIAHQLNNPLGVVLGNIQLLIKKLSSKRDSLDFSEIEELLKEAEENTKRCSQIINSLLQFGRRKTPQFEEVDIKELIELSLKFVEGSLLKKEIEIDKKIKPVKIWVDPVQIEQVFVNILLNAIQSIEEKGKIEIINEIIKEQEKNFLAIRFTDTGRGISEDNLKKIFEPFFSTKEISEGAGLGLSVSYGIVKAHRGEIKIRSKSGEGTQVTVILPLNLGEDNE